MTGKRYLNVLTTGDIQDIVTGELIRGSKIGALLNELYEDNQLLHKMNAEAIDFMYDNFDLNIMFTDRDLNNICNEMGWELSEKGIKINQLENENEKLKRKNKKLEKHLRRFYSDEEWELKEALGDFE